jgi:hypothetical protein
MVSWLLPRRRIAQTSPVRKRSNHNWIGRCWLTSMRSRMEFAARHYGRCCAAHALGRVPHPRWRDRGPSARASPKPAGLARSGQARVLGMEGELLDPKDARTRMRDTPATRSKGRFRLEGARPTRTGDLLGATLDAQREPLRPVPHLPLSYSNARRKASVVLGMVSRSFGDGERAPGSGSSPQQKPSPLGKRAPIRWS